MLVLDSCVLISTLKSPRVARNILRLFRGNNSRIALQDIVLKEAQKVLKLSREEIIDKIFNTSGERFCLTT